MKKGKKQETGKGTGKKKIRSVKERGKQQGKETANEKEKGKGNENPSMNTYF